MLQIVTIWNKLNLQNFAGENILSREEMKNVLGGFAEPGGGTCQGIKTGPQGDGTGWIDTQLSYSQASTGGYSHWCCDSCCQATWADHSGCPSLT